MAGQPDPFCRKLGEEGAWGAFVLASASAGMQDVGFSLGFH